MTELESWLTQATRGLSKDSIAQVRCEIQQHYELTQEATADGIAALGDPKLANRGYRKVLLTAAEARLLRDGNREARAFCSSPRARWLILCFVNVMLFVTGKIAWAPLALALGASLLLVSPLLPVYTAPRARIFRVVKWIALTGALCLAFAPNTLQWSWLLISCLWPLAWIESTRIAIRRKLPVAQWPKQLYL